MNVLGGFAPLRLCAKLLWLRPKLCCVLLVQNRSFTTEVTQKPQRDTDKSNPVQPQTEFVVEGDDVRQTI
jgi:hypothetical protein